MQGMQVNLYSGVIKCIIPLIPAHLILVAIIFAQEGPGHPGRTSFITSTIQGERPFRMNNTLPIWLDAGVGVCALEPIGFSIESNLYINFHSNLILSTGIEGRGNLGFILNRLSFPLGLLEEQKVYEYNPISIGFLIHHRDGIGMLSVGASHIRFEHKRFWYSPDISHTKGLLIKSTIIWHKARFTGFGIKASASLNSIQNQYGLVATFIIGRPRNQDQKTRN